MEGAESVACPIPEFSFWQEFGQVEEEPGECPACGFAGGRVVAGCPDVPAEVGAVVEVMVYQGFEVSDDLAVCGCLIPTKCHENIIPRGFG